MFRPRQATMRLVSLYKQLKPLFSRGFVVNLFQRQLHHRDFEDPGAMPQSVEK